MKLGLSGIEQVEFVGPDGYKNALFYAGKGMEAFGDAKEFASGHSKWFDWNGVAGTHTPYWANPLDTSQIDASFELILRYILPSQ